jgi:hypothetical protein
MNRCDFIANASDCPDAIEAYDDLSSIDMFEGKYLCNAIDNSCPYPQGELSGSYMNQFELLPYDITRCSMNPPPPQDTTPPTVGSPSISLQSGGASDVSLAITWDPATDNRTNYSGLRYSVYYSTSDANIVGANATVQYVETNGVFVSSFYTSTSFTLTGLTPDTQYFINVIVEDEAGYKAPYDGFVFTTLPSQS